MITNKIKIISWNVNGIRAILKKDFIKNIESINPDIIALQETKAHPEQVEHTIKKLGYEFEYWNSAEKKGYSGTAIFSKIKPIKIIKGLNNFEDKEGRVLTAEFENFYFVTVYTPNSKRELLRLEYRQEWDSKFLEYVSNLEKEKPVIFCGDLNVAHKEIDLKNPKANLRNPGFTIEERTGFDNILKKEFIDTFRELHPNEIKYTWWSYMFQARIKNIGWRIDYFCISKKLKNKLISAEIFNEYFGSDHCPIGIEIKKN